MQKLVHKRILVKFSGESVAGNDDHGIDPQVLNEMAASVKECKEIGAQIGVVIGGGNLFRGEKLNQAGMDRVAGDHMGMLATVMNAITLQDGLERAGVPTRVQSAIDMQQIAEPYIRRRAIRHLEKGRVVVFGGGCGNPFFTTDTTAALRAAEINAEVVFKATKVDGVYDRDPKKFTDAVKYDNLTFQDVLANEIGVMDSTAIALCKDNKIPIVVFNIFQPGNIAKAISGEPIGSRISNSS